MGRQSSDELYKLAAEITAKYVYFLLATAGAAIAYSVEVANHSKVTWSLLLLAVAILAWGISFYAGCRCLQWDISAHNVASESLRRTELIEAIQNSMPPAEFTELMQTHTDIAEQENNLANSHSSKSSYFLGLQFRLLILGVIAFVLWRMMDMVVNLAAS